VSDRVSSLTGIRGVAAVAVMIYHIPHLPIFADYRIALFSKAYLCVDLFFVLSGFVIAYGYGERVLRGPNPEQFRDFMINRIARVYPLHLVVALTFMAKAVLNISGEPGLSPTLDNVLTNVLMVQAWGFGTDAFAGNSWSVSTELAAYLLFPLLAFVAWSRMAWLLIPASATLLAGAALSGLGVEGVMDVVDPASLWPLLRCLAGFSLGLLAYRAYRNPSFAPTGDDSFLIAMMAAIGVAFAVPDGDLLVIVLFPLFILAIAHNGGLARALFANRAVFHLGVISYSIYLWHPLVRDVFGRALGVARDRGFDIPAGLWVGLLVLVTWLGSWASYRLIEVGGHRLVTRLVANAKARQHELQAAE
jgi:peptidoglycan/LPS O-acetylase OafA/YrhL